MDKRSSTISIRITPELEHQLQQIAAANDTTISSLVCDLCLAHVEDQRRRYEKLRAAFEDFKDLPRGTLGHD
jgi:predicted transcriptional regulator